MTWFSNLAHIFALKLKILFDFWELFYCSDCQFFIKKGIEKPVFCRLHIFLLLE